MSGRSLVWPATPPYSPVSIFLFSPLAWFHGTVALTYMVEAFFSALTGYLCWRIYCGAARFILPGAMVVGMAAGFRPSSLLLLGPLLLFSLRNANRKQAAAGMGALALTLLAWFIPMIRTGGGRPYLSSLVSLWLAVPSRGTVFNSSGWNSRGPRRDHRGHLFPLFRRRRHTPVPGAVRGFLDRPARRRSSRWSGSGRACYSSPSSI